MTNVHSSPSNGPKDDSKDFEFSRFKIRKKPRVGMEYKLYIKYPKEYVYMFN